MDSYTLFIFIAPLIAPILCVKIFEYHNKDTFESFFIYYNLWLYFLAYDVAGYYIVAFIYLFACFLVLIYLLFINNDKSSPFIGRYKFYFIASGCLLMISVIFGYDELKWFNINILLIQTFCFIIEVVINKNNIKVKKSR
ncbi:hypothetical protein PSECIP111951_03448 [Pseudoalteromonas holothuriae]|uniref:Uncharacterized protein n=1 Tax=Pseudoalteromonas holothuriae TaxID=2963714 RepID=A0ABM9GM24_9GAMM|nr:hypothetical protein [Pseudoalteromonas sp. CIP111951]CAH9065833.1 hypothetical protein PSECIP111951_03448 [Pseudoalteromonas sp. CIP111951]